MKIISHRGNLLGPCEKENHPIQVLEALRQGFDCEIDIRIKDKKFFLGHDNPQYEIDTEFIQQPGLWIHAKNLEALNELYSTRLNYFWHDSDSATITSHGYIWCYPGNYLENGITVIKERNEIITEKILGICTDFPIDYKK